MTSHRRLAALLAPIISLAVLAGCTSADTEPPSPEARASDNDRAATASGPPAGGVHSATDVCTYLQGEIPALKEIDSPVGRHANLAGRLATFFESHGKPPNGAALDAATREECPAVRTEVLSLIDVDSFSSF